MRPPVRSPRAVALAAAVIAALGTGAAAGSPLGQVETLPAVPFANSLVSGPDGNMWMVERSGSSIGRLTPGGVLTTFAAPAGASLRSIAPGPDGNLWYTDTGRNAIGRVTPAGAITEFPQADITGTSLGPISAGPDGNIWFARQDVGGNWIGRVTTSGDTGAIEQAGNGFLLSSLIPAGASGLFTTRSLGIDMGAVSTGLTVSTLANTVQGTGGIVAPDGALWYAATLTPAVRVWSPATQSEVAQHTLPASAGGGLTWGTDGNAWTGTVVGGIAGIQRVTPSGQVTSYPTGLAAQFVDSFTPAPDGDIWFIRTQVNGDASVHRIGTGAPAPVTVTVSGDRTAGTQHRCTADASAARLGTATSALQWTLDGAAIAGATSAAYTPPASAAGKALRCEARVTFSPSLIQIGATSAATTLVAAPSPSPSPVAPAKLRATWKVSGRTTRATFTRPARATSSRIIAVRRSGAAGQRTGRCSTTVVRRGRTVTRRVTCTITLPKGSWRVTAQTRRGTAVVAQAVRSVTVRR